MNIYIYIINRYHNEEMRTCFKSNYSKGMVYKVCYDAKEYRTTPYQLYNTCADV